MSSTSWIRCGRTLAAPVRRYGRRLQVVSRADRAALGFRPSARMTEWFSPTTLVDLAFRALWSALVARYADRREPMALHLVTRPPGRSSRRPAPGAEPAARGPDGDYPPADDGTLVVDYVADLGDGFHPTFTIAQLIASRRVALRPPGATGDATMPTEGGLRQADLVVMGGDEVYPRASTDLYWDRTLGPYSWALAHGSAGAPPPGGRDLFAIPGNHDWYDGLGEFSRVFCWGSSWSVGRTWATPQRAGYFALHLPHGWWLLGVDTQLAGDVDGLQQRYFDELPFRPGDRAIVCWTTPTWVVERDRPGAVAPTLAFIERLGRAGVGVPLVLTGDHHHYCRYVEGDDGAGPVRQWITAGGGGAFLHGTHVLPGHADLRPRPTDGWAPRSLTLAAAYPSCARSKAMRAQVLAFPVLNPRFGWVAGAASAWLVWARPRPRAFAVAAGTVALALIGLAKVGYRRWPAALAVGGAHALVQVGGAAATRALVRRRWDHPGGSVAAAALWAAGADATVGAYLYLAALLRSHDNEVWSALHSDRYKNFLRLRVTAAGDLEVHPVGVDRPGRWRFVPAPSTAPSGAPLICLADVMSTPPVAIEGALRFDLSSGRWSTVGG